MLILAVNGLAVHGALPFYILYSSYLFTKIINSGGLLSIVKEFFSYPDLLGGCERIVKD